MTRRRDFILGAAGAVLAPSSLAGSVPAGHPDAELFTAWRGYIKANRDFERACEVLPDGGTDEDHEPYYQALDFYSRLVEQHQSSTVEGFALQLRYLFARTMECKASFDAAIYGEPESEELTHSLDKDFRDKMLWDMAQAATRASRIKP